jgi:branched-chain amino acid transport system permease protein
MKARRSSAFSLAGWIAVAAALVYLAFMPLWSNGYIVTVGLDILLFASLAYSWNLISGYTGYVSFGNVVFFGVGGYALALLINHLHLGWLAAALLGALAAAVVAALLGLVMLRLREAYFAIGMLAVYVAALALAGIWTSATGGGSGLQLPPRIAVHQVYYSLLVVTVLCIVGSVVLERTTFGLRLMAIREDELAAQVHGVNTTIHKTIAFTLSGAIGGFVGALEAFYLSYIDPPTAFNALYNILMIMIVLFGGAGTATGPFVGAVSLGLLYEWLWASYPKLYLAIFGVLLIVIVLFIPRGIVPYVQQLLRPRRRAHGDLPVAQHPVPAARD